MVDKLRQAKSENERLKGEIDAFKSRIAGAAEDYVSGRTGWSRAAACTACMHDRALGARTRMQQHTVTLVQRLHAPMHAPVPTNS